MSLPERSQSPASGAVPIDVVVVGAGLQGLLVLDRVVGAGLSCVIVSETAPGGGQTLHSHGVLNTGFGLAGDEPVHALQHLVLPELHRRGVQTCGQWSMLLPAPGSTRGAPPSLPGGPSVTPPPGVELHGGRLVRLPEVNVDKHQLVDALVRGHEGRILRGTVMEIHHGDDGGVDRIGVQPLAAGTSAPLVMAPSVVVVAAGTGSKRLLRRLGADEQDLQAIRHRRVHVLCVQGPAEVLPDLNLVSLAEQFFVVSHEDSGRRTWYATPMDFGAPHAEEAPDDASAPQDRTIAARGWRSLVDLHPALVRAPGVRFGGYAGYRQDYGDLPGRFHAGPATGVPNVVMALPSGLVGAWPAALQAATLVAGLVSDRRPQPMVPGAGAAPAPAPAPEEQPDFVWSANVPVRL